MYTINGSNCEVKRNGTFEPLTALTKETDKGSLLRLLGQLISPQAKKQAVHQKRYLLLYLLLIQQLHPQTSFRDLFEKIYDCPSSQTKLSYIKHFLATNQSPEKASAALYNLPSITALRLQTILSLVCFESIHLAKSFRSVETFWQTHKEALIRKLRSDCKTIKECEDALKADKASFIFFRQGRLYDAISRELTNLREVIDQTPHPTNAIAVLSQKYQKQTKRERKSDKGPDKS